jgi:hypothetical protein
MSRGVANIIAAITRLRAVIPFRMTVIIEGTVSAQALTRAALTPRARLTQQCTGAGPRANIACAVIITALGAALAGLTRVLASPSFTNQRTRIAVKRATFVGPSARCPE